jgi:uncharacterized protein with PIN domain
MAKCPYCEKPVILKESGSQKQNEVRREVHGFIKKEVMYSCPHCERVLGFGCFFGGLVTGRPR